MNENPKRQGWSFYFWMLVLALGFAYLVTKQVSLPTGVLVAGALLGGLVLFFRGMIQPEIVTYALVAYLPFSRVLAGDFAGLAVAFNFTNLFIIFIVVVWLTGRYAAGEPLWLNSSLNIPVILFMLIGCVAVTRGTYYGSGYLSSAIIEYKRWITPLFFYFLALNTIKSREMIKNVVIIMAIVTTIAGLMAIYDYWDHGNVGSLEKSRIGGIAEQPNQLAAFFNYYMFLPFGFFLMNSKKFRYWLLNIPFLICFRGIMVTFSRGGYLAFAVGLYAITFFRSKILLLFLMLATLAVYMNPILIPAGIRYRMGKTFVAKQSYTDAAPEYKTENLEASAQNRVLCWQAGIQMIKEHPFWGIGYGLFPLMIVHYGSRSMDAHNQYLIIAAEMGIPALIIFLWCFFAVFCQTCLLYYQTHDSFAKALSLGMLGGLFGMLVVNMFGSRLSSQEISSYFWILAALIVRLRFLDNRERETGIGDEDTANEKKGKGKSEKLDSCWSE